MLTDVAFADGVRVETWIEPGTDVTPFYDPMIAKIIARGSDRSEAITPPARALAATRLSGIETNRAYLQHVLDAEAFREGRVHTRMLEDMAYQSATFEVLEPGTQTTVQDHPGRHRLLGRRGSRRRVRWTRCRFGSPIGFSATPRRRLVLGVHAGGAHAALSRSRGDRVHRRRHGGRDRRRAKSSATERFRLPRGACCVSVQ